MSAPKKSSKPSQRSKSASPAEPNKKHSVMYRRGKAIARIVAGRNRLSKKALQSLEGGLNEFLERLVHVALNEMKPDEKCIMPRHVASGLTNNPNLKKACKNEMHLLRVTSSYRTVAKRRSKKAVAAKPKK